MPRKCAVKCCNNRQKTRSSLIFHSVPTNNPERTNLWLLALNVDPNTPKETVKKMLVCSEHFLRDDYEKMELKNQTKRLLLKETAIPSIGITERVKKHEERLSRVFDEVMGLGEFADSSRGSATSSKSGGQDEIMGVDKTARRDEHQQGEDSNGSRQEEKLEEVMGEPLLPRISSTSSDRHTLFNMGTSQGEGTGRSGGAAFDDALDGMEDDEDWHFALPMGSLEDVPVGETNSKSSQPGRGNSLNQGDPFTSQPREDEEEEKEREGSMESTNTSHSSQDNTPENSRDGGELNQTEETEDSQEGQRSEAMPMEESNPQMSPRIKIKDEPIDEGYDAALLPQSSIRQVKEELEHQEEELKISSVYSVGGGNTFAAPAIPESTRGRASSRHGGEDSGWHEGDWQPNRFPFTATPGPQNAAAELESDLPADFLELILTDELLQHIADQTNLYADQFIQAHPDTLPHSRGKVWKPVSVPELKTFFGLSFLTGYIKKPNLELYWSVDEIDATPYFSQTMPRNRFQLIWRFLHYNNNASQDATDEMYEVRPVLDYIVGKFKELYQPFENICIDEGMMQWRGRLSFKVYNPQNPQPIKYGIKSYILCDSYTGYCYNMHPYVGQASSLQETVFSLLDRLPGHGYTLYMDNYYNSVALCEQLVKAKTNVCGTLRKNRGEPQIFREVTKTDLDVERKLVRHNGRVLVVAWQDKRLVKMVTTCHHDTMQRVEVWQKGHKEKAGQLKPECIVAYNACMNGVDKLDQNIAYYPFIRKSLNWPKKFVAYLFQLAIFNAFVLYKARKPGKCKTLLEFMRRVVRSWTAKRHVVKEGEEEVGGVEVEEGRTTRAPYNHDPSSRLDGQMGKHQLEYLMPTSKKPRPARRCRVCARRGQRSETRMWCRSCCVPLHAGECYMAYHTKQKFS